MNDLKSILIITKLPLFSTAIGHALMQDPVYSRISQVNIIKSIHMLPQALESGRYHIVLSDYVYRQFEMDKKFIGYPGVKIFITEGKAQSSLANVNNISINASISEASEVFLRGLQQVDIDLINMPLSLSKNSLDSKKECILTPREMEVLKLIYAPMGNKEIATSLFISPQTVSVHRKNIMKKLGVNNSVGLIKQAKKLMYI